MTHGNERGIDNIITKMERAPDIPREIRRCAVCGKPIEKLVNIPLLGYQNKIVKVNCECEEKAKREQEERDKFAKKQERMKNLKISSLLGKRYHDACFGNTVLTINEEFNRAYSRCKKYCENYKQVISHGFGMYIFGSVGVGKTHLIACMANYLLSECVPVLVTNMFDISQTIKRTFTKNSTFTEGQALDNISNIPVLFLDDLGAEEYHSNGEKDTWLNAILAQIINKRYNEKRPTVFSSNYSLNELILKRGIFEMTVDRIAEMTKGAVVKVTGKSKRIDFTNELPF